METIIDLFMHLYKCMCAYAGRVTAIAEFEFRKCISSSQTPKTKDYTAELSRSSCFEVVTNLEEGKVWIQNQPEERWVLSVYLDL